MYKLISFVLFTKTVGEVMEVVKRFGLTLLDDVVATVVEKTACCWFGGDVMLFLAEIIAVLAVV